MGIMKVNEHGLLMKHTRTPDEVKRLLKVIDTLPHYVGAQPWGDDELPIVLVANFIMKRFGRITPDQITDAFELGAAGELHDGNQRVKITTYGKQLDIDVVGTVLMAYKQRLQKERARPKHVNPVPTTHQIGAGEPFVATPQFHYENMMKQIKESGEMPRVHLWQTIHDYMVENLGMKTMVRGSVSGDVYRAVIHTHLVGIGVIVLPETDDVP